MPTYDYKCSDCGYSFERFQKMTDQPLTECPVCKGSVKRLIGAGIGPLFKGSGFYHTDYKTKASNKSESSNSAKSENVKASESEK
ncbi:MAG: FmdB family transcriptional regulator [Ignavibacteria bacterium RBG_13_36_8]|nr:MAG: FmdB family transcriptional regulator [Ignavibacteria bacterium RBG_13_36_8]